MQAVRDGSAEWVRLPPSRFHCCGHTELTQRNVGSPPGAVHSHLLVGHVSACLVPWRLRRCQRRGDLALAPRQRCGLTAVLFALLAICCIPRRHTRILNLHGPRLPGRRPRQPPCLHQQAVGHPVAERRDGLRVGPGEVVEQEAGARPVGQPAGTGGKGGGRGGGQTIGVCPRGARTSCPTHQVDCVAPCKPPVEWHSDRVFERFEPSTVKPT